MKKTCGPPPGPGGVRYSHARSVCPPSVIASAEPVRSSDGVVSRTIWYSGMKTVVGKHMQLLLAMNDGSPISNPQWTVPSSSGPMPAAIKDYLRIERGGLYQPEVMDLPPAAEQAVGPAAVQRAAASGQ